VALQSLVKHTRKDNFLVTFGFIAQRYLLSHIFFILDQMLVRGLIWGALAVGLQKQGQWQLIVLTTLQLWYLWFVIWQRPFRTAMDQFSLVCTELGMLLILVCCWVLKYYNSYFEILPVISLIHVGVVLISVYSHVVKYFYRTCCKKVKA
jgi:hypothetical protein